MRVHEYYGLWKSNHDVRGRRTDGHRDTRTDGANHGIDSFLVYSTKDPFTSMLLVKNWQKYAINCHRKITVNGNYEKMQLFFYFHYVRIFKCENDSISKYLEILFSQLKAHRHNSILYVEQ